MAVQCPVVVASAELVEENSERWNAEENPANQKWVLFSADVSRALKELNASDLHVLLRDNTFGSSFFGFLFYPDNRS